MTLPADASSTGTSDNPLLVLGAAEEDHEGQAERQEDL